MSQNNLTQNKEKNISHILNECIESIEINKDCIYLKLNKNIIIDSEQSISIVSGDMLILQGDFTHINHFKKRSDIFSIKNITKLIKQTLVRITNGK